MMLFIKQRLPYRSAPSLRRWLCCLVVLAISGCGGDDPIREYIIPKQPTGGTVWFFKVIGPDEAVAEAMEPIRKFADTIQFDAQTGVPEWKLPEGWTEELPGSGFRYRTLTIPGSPSLELAVSHVAGRVPPDDDEVRTHANLLRGQVGLEEFAAGSEDFAKSLDDGEIETIGQGSQTGRLFNFFGKTARHGDSRLIAVMVPSAVKLQLAPQSGDEMASPAGRAPFTFETPDGWKEAPQTQFSVVSLSAADGSKTVSITVTPALGGVLANVNRWRGQAGLSSLSEDQMQQELESIDANGVTVRYAEAIGETRGVLGGIVEHDGQQWFVKLDGDPDLARREREKFREFLASIQF